MKSKWATLPKCHRYIYLYDNILRNSEFLRERFGISNCKNHEKKNVFAESLAITICILLRSGDVRRRWEGFFGVESRYPGKMVVQGAGELGESAGLLEIFLKAG